MSLHNLELSSKVLKDISTFFKNGVNKRIHSCIQFRLPEKGGPTTKIRQPLQHSGMEVEPDGEMKVPQFEVTTTMPRTYLCCNRYLLLDKLGKGGFGLIYAGVDITNGNKVAIKLVHYDTVEHCLMDTGRYF